jgi:hypothetical protein
MPEAMADFLCLQFFDMLESSFSLSSLLIR